MFYVGITRRCWSKLLSITPWQMPTPCPSRHSLCVVSHVTWSLTALCPQGALLLVTGGPLPSEEISRQRLFFIHLYILATPPPAVPLTASTSRPPSCSPWRESGWAGEVVTRPEGAWTMVINMWNPEFITFRHHTLWDRAQQRTWFAADNLKNGPEMFGQTQESILFLMGKKSRRLAILD